MNSSRRIRCAAWAAVAVLAAVLAGCSKPQPVAAGKPVVITSVYALQFAAEAVAGESAQVVNLTPAGVEPHDLELSVQQVRQMQDAQLIVYVAGLAHAVDDSVAETGAQRIEARAALGADAIPGDPHFWLNPLLMAKVADAIAQRLGTIDPANAGAYKANAEAFATRMSALDADWMKRTNTCATRDFVSSHASFAYLAKRYNFTARAVLGLNPDAEPTPAALSEAISIIRNKNLSTMYGEALLNTKIANTIAKETGAKVRVLDPMEGNTGNVGYKAIMQANLDSIVAGNGCTS